MGSQLRRFRGATALALGVVALLSGCGDRSIMRAKQAEFRRYAGFAALRVASDPVRAAGAFRRALESDPDDAQSLYGLAVSLDLAGHRDEAAKVWQRLERQADSIADPVILHLLSERVGHRVGSDAQTVMNEGLRQLYVVRDPAAAEREFRRLVAVAPTHLGANYQLAMALELQGRTAEAALQWRIVRELARSYGDGKTEVRAEERLGGRR